MNEKGHDRKRRRETYGGFMLRVDKKKGVEALIAGSCGRYLGYWCERGLGVRRLEDGSRERRSKMVNY